MWYMNEEREMLVKLCRRFAEKELGPFVPQMENGAYPKELLKKLGQIGVLGLVAEKEYGGSGIDWVSYGLVLEELAKVSSTFALLTAQASDLTVGAMHRHCTQDQLERIIKPAIRGELLMSTFVTEACGIFNLTEYTTRAVADGDSWIINGSKVFGTNTGVADINIVACITADQVNPATAWGFTCFAVPTNTPGFSVGHLENKLGWRGSHTGQSYYQNCRIPKENQLGPLHEGLSILTENLIPGYCNYGAMALGSMESVYHKTYRFLHERIENGKSLWDANQVTRNDMARLWIQIENFRGAVFTALENRNRGEDVTAHAIALKVQGQQLMERVASECIELHGGIGTVFETGIERFYRDAKMLSVGCGSNKTQLDTLAYMI